MASHLRRGRKATFARFASFAVTTSAIMVACGSRTGLLVDENETPPDATPDMTVDTSRPDAHDARADVHDARPDQIDAMPIKEGGPLDAKPECDAPPYCDPKDPGKIFKCGVPIFQCNSLEQCEQMGEDAAKCVNPCLDTLGQNTSNGCEFYIAEMDTSTEPSNRVAGVCYAVYVVNQWKTGEPARIEVDLGGNVLPIDQFARIPVGQGANITYAPYDPVAGLAKDQIAILFLSRDPNAKDGSDSPASLADCPPGVTPAVVGDAAFHGTGVASAFHIRTNVPVVAYDMLPYGAGRARVTSASLLLPTNVWDTNYLVTNAFENPSAAVFSPSPLPTLMVFGQQDGTNVTLLPTQSIEGGNGLPGTAAGTPVTYTVNAGQYVQITQLADLTGTVIQSDKPVAVVGGKQEIDVPIDTPRADSAHQMLPPVRALGNEYVAVRYRARRGRPDESVPWRIVGAVDGTQLSYDPPQPGAPSVVNARELVEFTAPGPFVVSSQDAAHPFYISQHMTGGEFTDAGGADNAMNGEGDPEFVNVISPAQYLPRYTFFTDPTYPETNLVVTRVLDPTTNTFPDVTLDCAGLLGGWQPVGSSGRYQFTRVDLSTGNFEGQNGCDNGVHTIVATLAAGGGDGGPGPTPLFGVTVWGWGNPITDPVPGDDTNPRYTRWVSYGYPAGANVKPLNSVVVPAR